MSARALQQIGNADYRANGPSGHVHTAACYVPSEGPTAAPICGYEDETEEEDAERWDGQS